MSQTHLQVSLETAILFLSRQSYMGPLYICPPQAEAREALAMSHSQPTQRQCCHSRPHLFMFCVKSYRKKSRLVWVGDQCWARGPGVVACTACIERATTSKTHNIV